MHELSIALSIVDGALEELGRHQGARAQAIHLRLGRLSGVDREALLFSYDVARRETELAGSHLIIEDVEVAIFCPACRADRPVRLFPLLLCAECGALGERVVHGQELEIIGMEVIA
ncbi:MAG TPA: hydrogenase maturation nickel metallochaperone HypA [Terriglobales bacterium]|nr:hydrogenase maturation nickel metallochaperone HypA [Terriglobales bacterium]